MKIYHQIACHTKLYISYNINTMDNFAKTINNKSLQFKKVDFLNLNKTDIESYIQHTNDYDAVKQMLGSIFAVFFGAIHLFSKDFAYNMLTKQLKSDMLDQKYEYHMWFIYHDDRYIGYINLRTPENKLAETLKFDKYGVLELGASLVNTYRGKGYISAILKNLLPIFKEYFCKQQLMIMTQSDNSIVQHLATKSGFKYVGQWCFEFEIPILNIISPTMFVYIFE